MRKFSLFGLLLAFVSLPLMALERNPQSVSALLNRIGGKGAAKRFVTIVEPEMAQGSADVFVITAEKGKPCIKGNSVLSVATGINWYLNHYAHINLAWNNLTTNLTTATLPLPKTEEWHTSTAPYRYYLNYCTFSYSMSVWTWERWEQEIDWMALHGINMPLALVGLEVVWKGVLEEMGYSAQEVNAFVAGPAFQAWWAMNNLEGWGGENPEWWYHRQESLSRQVLQRQRELGMKPVLPGYSGMVPRNSGERLGLNIAKPGFWCTFPRPGFLLPTDTRFEEMAQRYYKHLHRVMGRSDFYSMDPFHEGGSTAGVDIRAAYRAIAEQMHAVNPRAKWVLQSWNENPLAEALLANPKGTYIVLDLFSDGIPRWQEDSSGHEMIYCMLHNFGGRTGLHGRLAKTVTDYYKALEQHPNTILGIGATAEGIETNPMLYDALFELPWTKIEDPYAWLNAYVQCRYGASNAMAEQAWQRLGKSLYNCPTDQQGTSEAVLCARPALTVNSVSTWSTSELYYNPEEVYQAAWDLVYARELSGNANYRFDLIDVTRQALTDYAATLLLEIRNTYIAKDMATFEAKSQRFLDLILDLDAFLAQEPLYNLGRWTSSARRIALEGKGTKVEDEDWLEWNARTLITVWGTESAANTGGLRDYSNRVWSGLLRDFYYPRWQRFFKALTNGQPTPSLAEWFAMEEAWTKNFQLRYTDAQPTATLSPEVLLRKYIGER